MQSGLPKGGRGGRPFPGFCRPAFLLRLEHGKAERPVRRKPIMTQPNATKGQRWAILLAGGEGERLRPLTERWLGYHRPKQYCTFVGSRSMLQHTLERARCL